MKHTTVLSIVFVCFLALFTINPVKAQAEVTGWGNLKGFRLEGQLMEVNSSLLVAGSSWADLSRTAKEQQQPIYNRVGNQQVIKTKLAGLFSIVETIEDDGTGKATIDLQFTALKDTSITGAYLSLMLPGDRFQNGKVSILNPQEIPLEGDVISSKNELVRIHGTGARFNALEQNVEVSSELPGQIIVRQTPEGQIEFLMAITNGTLQKGQVIQRSYSISVEGTIDQTPAQLVMDANVTGRVFDGFGGNFRLQNPDTDPQVIEYCLENMRVAWARVEMPWGFWHRDENTDPLEAARAGKIHDRVRAAMEIAQKIHKRGIPVIVSAWSGPEWAIVGKRSFRPQPDGTRGNPLNPEKAEQIYNSITAYILYLKEAYGVEAEMFSFNESDLGIYIRQTGAEHRDLIKGLGAYFASKGLKTRLLLGDTADANGWPFLAESMSDSETLPYIGAVSFHSWRGWETETLQKWADAAEQVKRPLVVGEGSTDAAAWKYPDIFQEQIYIMEEIVLYIRILAICQPQTILQWQLTADYSPLAGGGIFGDEGPLRPIQRFWNMKQLSSTPAGLAAIPITSDQKEVTCAALGDPKTNSYTIHVVNNGAQRETTITGLPEKVKKLKVYVTDSNRGMEDTGEIAVAKGQVNLLLDPMSYVTLVTVQQ